MYWDKLEEILGKVGWIYIWRFFLNTSVGHWKWRGAPHLACGPLITHPCSKLILRRTHVFRNYILCLLQCKPSCQKLVHCHARAELFHNISLYRDDTGSNCDHFVLQFQPKFYLLVTPTRLWQNEIGLCLPQGHAK